jgi:DNA-binding NtrC family response regulator
MQTTSKLIIQKEQPAIFILVSDEYVRHYLYNLCKKFNYHPQIASDVKDLAKKLKKSHNGIAFVDHQTVISHGSGIYRTINIASPSSKVILLFDQANRRLVKEAMEAGVYACIMAPYNEWEVFMITRQIFATQQAKRGKNFSTSSNTFSAHFLQKCSFRPY